MSGGCWACCDPRVGDGSCRTHHVRGLVLAPGTCVPGMLWHPTPSLPLLSLSLRVLKEPTCLSLSLSPHTMIPLSAGEVKSCLCGCCWQTPSLEAASNHTPACFTLGLQLPGFTEKSYFSKEPVFKEELCVSDWPGTRGLRARHSLPASSSPALGCGNSRWLPAEPGDWCHLSLVSWLCRSCSARG